MMRRVPEVGAYMDKRWDWRGAGGEQQAISRTVSREPGGEAVWRDGRAGQGRAQSRTRRVLRRGFVWFARLRCAAVRCGVVWCVARCRGAPEWADRWMRGTGATWTRRALVKELVGVGQREWLVARLGSSQREATCRPAMDAAAKKNTRKRGVGWHRASKNGR